MVEQITIRPFDLREHEAELLAAHSIHFEGADSDAKRASYVSWLLANPVEGSIYLAAYVDGKFASFLALLARQVVGFGHVFCGVLAAAAVTLPEFSGRGLYRRLAYAGWEQARLAGFDFAVGYTIRAYVLDLELRMGWSKCSVAPVMGFPLDVPAVLRMAAPRLGGLSRLASPASPIARRIARMLAAGAGADDYSVAVAEGFSAEFDELSDRLRDAELIHFAKNRRALEWLYRSPHRPFDYDIVTARQAGQLVGFAVGRRMDLLGLDGYGILDLIAIPGHDEALRPLAGRLVSLALERRSQIIGALTSAAQPANKALRRLGFVNTRHSFTLIYRPLQQDLPEPLSHGNNWCNFWGNNDTA
jgi:hypothetical protein